MTDPTAAPDILEPYASPDGEDLMLEGFAPAPEARNGAAVIFVHGGGWNSGDRQQFAWHAREAARQGYFGCTIDYRPATTAVFPAALKDCQTAVRWTRRHAERLGIRPDCLGNCRARWSTEPRSQASHSRDQGEATHAATARDGIEPGVLKIRFRT
jgi:acetyl esterase/lipase